MAEWLATSLIFISSLLPSQDSKVTTQAMQRGIKARVKQYSYTYQ